VLAVSWVSSYDNQLKHRDSPCDLDFIKVWQPQGCQTSEDEEPDQVVRTPNISKLMGGMKGPEVNIVPNSER
jgi:hypothetical protein